MAGSACEMGNCFSTQNGVEKHVPAKLFTYHAIISSKLRIMFVITIINTGMKDMINASLKRIERIAMAMISALVNEFKLSFFWPEYLN